MGPSQRTRTLLCLSSRSVLVPVMVESMRRTSTATEDQRPTRPQFHAGRKCARAFRDAAAHARSGVGSPTAPNRPRSRTSGRDRAASARPRSRPRRRPSTPATSEAVRIKRSTSYGIWPFAPVPAISESRSGYGPDADRRRNARSQGCDKDRPEPEPRPARGNGSRQPPRAGTGTATFLRGQDRAPDPQLIDKVRSTRSVEPRPTPSSGGPSQACRW